jgi:hypothetical protein
MPKSCQSIFSHSNLLLNINIYIYIICHSCLIYSLFLLNKHPILFFFFLILYPNTLTGYLNKLNNFFYVQWFCNERQLFICDESKHHRLVYR